MEPLGHVAIGLRHLGDLREHVAFSAGRLQLFRAPPHGRSFLGRESLGRLGGALLCRLPFRHWSTSRFSRVGRRRGDSREGRHYSWHISGGGSVVLVDEAAEPVAAADRADSRCWCWLLRLGWLELEGTVRALRVVVVDVDAEHPLEVASV